MPWPSDLSEQEKAAPPVAEKVANPTPSSEPAGPKPSSGPSGESSSGGPIRELRPSLYYLRDKQGNLQPVPGFTLEEFRELYELKHLLEQKAQPPGYSVQTLEIQGEVRGAQAELTIELRVGLQESSARIPLRLEGMAVRKFEGEGWAGGAKGEYLLHWEEGEGYVAWVSGGPGTTHRIRLEGLLRVHQVGEQRRLRFRCIRAPMAQMRLRAPGEGLKVEVSDPATLLEVLPASEGRTEMKLEGLGGNVELIWQPKGQDKQKASTVFEVTGETIAQLEREKITTQANLLIKVLGQPCNEIEIRLPEGARWNSAPSIPGGTVTVEKADRIKVHFLEKAMEHRVRLEWEQPIGNQGSEGWVELGGLEVVGAVKHRGYLAVWGTGDWHLLWRVSASVRQTEQLPPSLLGEGLLAGFEYTSQPYSVRARLASQQVRVSVEPEYRLWVSAREVKLEGVLKCTIRGAKVQGLRVEMPGWELEEVGPETAAEGAARMEGSFLEIPLKQPTGGHVELTMVARRAIPPGTKQLLLPLPQGWQVEWPKGGAVSVLPASVVVIPEENVELAPEEKQMSGWTPQLAVPPSGLPKRQQPILAYRVESGVGSFAAGFRVHERLIHVEGTAQLRVEEDGVHVEEKLSYTIAYELVGTLTVWAPSTVAAGTVQFQVDGQAVSPVLVSSSPKGPEDGGPVQMAAPLPQPRIGMCDLTIRYRIAAEKILPLQTQLRTIPLVLPAEGKWMGWRLGITSAEGLQIKVRGENWKPLENLPESVGKENRLVIGCSEPASEVLLGVYRQQGQIGRPIGVSRAFVQTWWTRSVREDRAVYRLSGGKKELTVLLPEGANTGEVEILVNGQPTTVQAASDGRMVIPLPGEKAGPVVVEIRYHFDPPRPPRGYLPVAFPRLEPDVWIDQFYWLCHLPRDEHLLTNPPGFCPEYQWRWNGWSWGRVPRWSQADLETWSGAVSWPMPPEGVNSYLFSSLGRIEMAYVYTAGRSVIVLTASLATLGIGLLVIYVPMFVHPAWLIFVGIGLGALIHLYPEQTVLVGQASLLGVVLAGVAGVLQRMIVGRRLETVRTPGLGLEHESTQRQYPPPPPGSTASTQAMPSPGPATISPEIPSG